MTTRKAMQQLKSVWGKAGLNAIPTPDEVKGNMGEPAANTARGRKKSERTARLDVRCTPDEKKRVQLIAVDEGQSVNEIFSRMLSVYERERSRGRGEADG
jgi:hypothetical protein